MILKSIRLHPFGGTRDTVRSVGRGITTYVGRNEAGKSTLRQAIHHALFTPTDLTPARARNLLSRWYPRPDGDHAEVTLVFEHEGGEWTLAKRWGSDARSALTSSAGVTIGDPTTVQETLTRLLGHNEATSRLVLCTGQAELVHTSELLAGRDGTSVTPVADLTRTAAAVAGDIHAERLRTALEATVEEAFGRWDDATAAPMLDKGRERGVSHPWKVGAGSVVKAWYAWRAKAEEHEQLLRQERELHAVSAELADLEARVAADTAFLAAGSPLRDGLNRRHLVALALDGMREKDGVLTAIAGRWPVAQAESTASRQAVARLLDRRERLIAEQEAARLQGEAALTLAEFDGIAGARTAWQAAEQAVRASGRPTAEAVAELERLGERIRHARNRIEAQKLSYAIVTTEPCRVLVTEGDARPHEVALDGGTSGLARSRLRIEAGPLSVTVTSGEEDVEPLFRGLEQDLAREAAVLAACGAASLVDVKADVTRHDGLVAAERSHRDAYESRLRGRSFEHWQEAVAAVARLPVTRPLDTIAGDLAGVESDIRTEQGKIAVHDASIRDWISRYKNQESLLEQLVFNRTQAAAAEGELKGLPTTPAGFTTVAEFLEKLTGCETAVRDHGSRIKELVARQQMLRDQVGERTAAELAEESESLRRAFDRLAREGRAYRRILAVLDEVLNEEQADPLQGFTATVTDYFRTITGGADELEFAGQLPALVGRGPVRLEPELLSHGARTALALALRLALSEVHLGPQPGFIILDDPFVEIDADRRKRATDLLRQFATRHQVIFLTCHEDHAVES